MRLLLSISAALCSSASLVAAGGVDRSAQAVGVIFKEGNFGVVSFGAVAPDVSGVQIIPIGPFGPGSRSGDMTEDYLQFSAAYKHDFGNAFEAAIILDQPFGAGIEYPSDENYFIAGSTAELNSTALTGVVKYNFPSNLSVYGGVRYQRLDAQAFIPFVTRPPGPGIVAPGAPYSADGEEDASAGYLVGIGYEIPAIALRVSLTYNSAIEHQLDTSESSALGLSSSTTEIETPQSVNLEFETGIAADTLLFGAIRWVEWSEFEISPQDYLTLTGGTPLVSYEGNRTTYSLGIGRRFSDSFAGAVSFSYEAQDDELASNLGPTDGHFGLAVGGTYTVGNVELTGGLRYIWLGDTQTSVQEDVAATDFDDNSAVAVGLEVGYRF